MIHFEISTMNETEIDSNIRSKIIIFDEYLKHRFKRCSDIELAGVYSNNKNNLEIFEKLLYEKRKEKYFINNLLIKIIQHIGSRASIDAIKLLIECGGDVNIKDNDNLNLLMICCFKLHNNIEILKLLIENGADVNIKNATGKTTLMYTLQHVSCDENLEIFKLLIKNDYQINSKDKYGDTPLMIYIFNNNNKYIRCDIIKLLLDNKADVYIQNDQGENILKYIKKHFDMNSDVYSLIFNYKNLKNHHLCECDIDFIYKNY